MLFIYSNYVWFEVSDRMVKVVKVNSKSNDMANWKKSEIHKRFRKPNLIVCTKDGIPIKNTYYTTITQLSARCVLRQDIAVQSRPGTEKCHSRHATV